ncbi:hypothetical protein BJ742DRAFT_674804 [Cladochytrium replicatum]|nr:hypothetical protein BJ742DRAFT_674804 [Cladochytrium replicatum]
MNQLRTTALSRLIVGLLLFTILSNTLVAAASAPSSSSPDPPVSCVTDDDCTAANKRYGWTSDGASTPAGFLCIKSQCTLVRKAGEFCTQASECAIYQYIQRNIERNVSLNTVLPNYLANSAENLTAFMNSICDSTQCTYASTCDYSKDPLFIIDNQPSSQYEWGNAKCCSGGGVNWQCTQMGTFLDTCNASSICTPFHNQQLDPSLGFPVPDPNHQYCSTDDLRSTQWIGIVLSLIGSALLNVGLNVQKLALRKRHEARKERERSQILEALQSIRDKFARTTEGTGRHRTSSKRSLFGFRNSNALELSDLTKSGVSDISEDQGAIIHVEDTTSLPRVGQRRSLLSGFRGRISTLSHWSSTTVTISRITPVAPPSGPELSPQDSVPPAPVDEKPISPVSDHPHSDASTGEARRSSSTRVRSPSGLRIDTSSPVPIEDVIVASPHRPPQTAPATAASINVGGHQYPPGTPRNRRQSRIDTDIQGLALPTSPADNIAYENKLGLFGLFKNPIWVCGLLLFTIGNLLSFVALQYAAQSLIAPLGSISLVVNVIIAPLINKERWTWKDIVGIIFIVGGSAMVVLFAGVSGKDYKLCFLLHLFTRVPTIVFLSITAFGVAVIFCSIVTIEKNMDIHDHKADQEDDATKEALTETIAAVTGASPQAAAEVIMELQQERPTRIRSPGQLSLSTSPEDRGRSRPPMSAGSITITTPSPPTRVRARSISSVTSRLLDQQNSEPATGNTTGMESGSDKETSAPITPLRRITVVPPVPLQKPELSYSYVSHNSPAGPPILLPSDGAGGSSTPRRPLLAGASANNNTPPMVLTGTLAPVAHLSTNVRPPSRPISIKSMAHALPRPMQNSLWTVIVSSRKIQLIPRLKNKIPLESRLVRVWLPFAYASLGGLMATITVLFAKSTIHLLSTTIVGGNNQYDNILAYVITLVTIITAVSQVYWINMGLQRYDALLQVPVFYVVWTLFDVVGGGIYFDEFKDFTTVKYILFCSGVSIIFMGVAILATRLKKLADEETAMNAAVAGAVEPSVGIESSPERVSPTPARDLEMQTISIRAAPKKST